MTSIKTIIFDLDGTLVDSAPGIIECFQQTLRVKGIQPIIPLDSRLIGPPLRETLQCLTGISEDDPLLGVLAEEFKSRYDSTASRTTPAYAGITSALKEICAQGIGLHIATNKRIIPTRQIVEHLGWNQFFASIYARDSFSPPLKSKAQLIGCLLQEQAVDYQNAIYVGDTQEDGDAAKQNQIQFWAALWGYGQFDYLEENSFFRTLPTTAAIVRQLAPHE